MFSYFFIFALNFSVWDDLVLVSLITSITSLDAVKVAFPSCRQTTYSLYMFVQALLHSRCSPEVLGTSLHRERRMNQKPRQLQKANRTRSNLETSRVFKSLTKEAEALLLNANSGQR